MLVSKAFLTTVMFDDGCNVLIFQCFAGLLSTAPSLIIHSHSLQRNRINGKRNKKCYLIIHFQTLNQHFSQFSYSSRCLFHDISRCLFHVLLIVSLLVFSALSCVHYFLPLSKYTLTLLIPAFKHSRFLCSTPSFGVWLVSANNLSAFNIRPV